MGNKVILINPSCNIEDNQSRGDKNGNIFVNIGLIVIGTVLKRKGYHVKLFDASYDNLDYLLKKEMARFYYLFPI